jgi:hypothetical protein
MTRGVPCCVTQIGLHSLKKALERHTMAATIDARTAPAVTFNARNAVAYERVMGQWSRRLAPLLIRFGGLADGAACWIWAAAPAA